MYKYGLLEKIFVFLLFASFVCSMYPWFVWNNYSNIFISCATFFCAAMVLYKFRLWQRKMPVFLILFLIASFLWDSVLLVPFMKAISCMNIFILITLIMQDDYFKKDLLNFITKWLGIIVFISLIAYVLYSLDLFPITPKKIQFGNRYHSYNYYLFIIPQEIFVDFFVRFRSIFMEPGHMALGTTMLIIANKFDLKNKYVLMLILGNIFSFSLAAYVTMSIGFLLYNFSIKKIHLFAVLVGVLCLANLIVVKIQGGEILDRYLWDRLEYSEETGEIEGNNRITIKYESVYEMTLSRFDLLILGNDEYERNDDYGGNAGYKKYIVEKGLLGIFLVLLFYLYAPIKFRSKDAIIFSVLILLLLAQDSYPFWSCMSISYILGMPNMSPKEDSFNTDDSEREV